MKKKRKLKIGILSDSPFITTGYFNILTKITKILRSAGHEVVYFATTYMGQKLKPGTKFEDDKRLDFRIIGGGREAYFKDVLPIYTKKYNLDVLFILLDTFMLYPWLPTLALSPA